MPTAGLDRAALFVTACSALTLGLQFLFQIVMASLFGAARGMDAYFVGLAIPMFLLPMLQGSLGQVLVSVAAAERGGLAPAGRFMGGMAAGLVAVSLIVWGGADWLAAVLAPGFAAPDRRLVSGVLRWLSPGIALGGWAVLLNGLAYARGRYRSAALAPVAGAAVMGAGAWLAGRSGSVEGLAAATAAGWAVQALLLTPGFLSDGGRVLWPGRDGWTARVWSLAWPLIPATVFVRLEPVIDRALASLGPAGTVAHLGYASRLVLAAVALTSSGYIMMSLPALSELVAQGRREELRRLFARTMRTVLLVSLPLAVVLAAFGEPLIRFAFARGAFSAEDARAVAGMLAAYLGVLVAAAPGSLLTNLAVAIGETRFPAVVTIVGTLLGTGLKALLVWTWSPLGIAVGSSAMFLGNVGVLAWGLRRRLGWVGGKTS